MNLSWIEEGRFPMQRAIRIATVALALTLLAGTGPQSLWAESAWAAAEAGPGAGESGEGPADGEARELEREFQGLIEELKELEKGARDKLREEILPRIREEIRRLRDKLREFELDTPPPPETRET